MRLILFLFFALPVYADTINNVVIIGSGPAGLAAALCAARMQLAPIVIEGDDPGGNLIYAGTIENWPGEPTITGPELIGRMRNHAESQGTQFVSNTVSAIDLSQSPYTLLFTDSTTMQAWSVIIASGTSPQKINCPGEDQYWGHGIAICPICDGPLFKRKAIAVVGSGEEAITRALFMLQYTSNITVICSESQLVSCPSLRNKLLMESTINVIYNAQVTEIVGDGKKVTGVRINTQPELIPVAGVFLALGEQGRTEWLDNQLTLDDKGHILLDGPTTTAVPGLFAAGTVATTDAGRPYTLALAAAGSGCMAALAAWNYICDVQGSAQFVSADLNKAVCPDCWSS